MPLVSRDLRVPAPLLLYHRHFLSKTVAWNAKGRPRHLHNYVFHRPTCYADCRPAMRCDICDSHEEAELRRWREERQRDEDQTTISSAVFASIRLMATPRCTLSWLTCPAICCPEACPTTWYPSPWRQSVTGRAPSPRNSATATQTWTKLHLALLTGVAELGRCILHCPHHWPLTVWLLDSLWITGTGLLKLDIASSLWWERHFQRRPGGTKSVVNPSDDKATTLITNDAIWCYPLDVVVIF